jgi:hypothetical protein
MLLATPLFAAIRAFHQPSMSKLKAPRRDRFGRTQGDEKLSSIYFGRTQRFVLIPVAWISMNIRLSGRDRAVRYSSSISSIASSTLREA